MFLISSLPPAPKKDLKMHRKGKGENNCDVIISYMSDWTLMASFGVENFSQQNLIYKFYF